MVSFLPLTPAPFLRRPVLLGPYGPDGIEVWTDDGTVTETYGRDQTLAMLAALAQRKGQKRAKYDPDIAPGPVQLYWNGSRSDLFRVTGALGWTAERRRKASVTKFRHDCGISLRMLPVSLRDTNERTALGLFEFCEWARDQGVGAKGFGAMGTGLWRSMLPERVTFMPPPAGCDFATATMGGRVEAPLVDRSRPLRNMAYWDIRSAYPAAMAREPFPQSLWPVHPTTRMDGTGIAEAAVSIGEPIPFGPLALPLARQSPYVTFGTCERYVTSFWSWRELRAAREAGHTVKVVRSWAGRFEQDAFGEPWETIVGEGRALPLGGRFAKAAFNATWGGFASKANQVDYLRWTDPDGLHFDVTTPKVSAPMPIEAAGWVATEILARVRSQLFVEALSRPGAVYCDTDGVIAPEGWLPAREGDRLGDWSKRQTMRQVQIKGPRLYRWAEEDDPQHFWRYLTAGVPKNDRETQVRAFEDAPDRGPRLAALSGSFTDTVILPAVPVTTARQLVGLPVRP